MTRPMWCSTSSTVRSSRSRSSRRKSPNPATSSWLRPPAGSSSSSSRGSRDERAGELDALQRRVGEAPTRRARRDRLARRDRATSMRASLAVRLAEPARRANARRRGRSRAPSSARRARCSGTSARCRGGRRRTARPSAGPRRRRAHGAGIRLVESSDDVEGRRLARAVRADQSEDLTLGDVERDVVEGDDAPEAAGEVLDGEQRHEAGILRRGGETSPAVVPLDDGIVRITFPLPLGIDHVHAYVLPADDGGTLLVDTGLGLPGRRRALAAHPRADGPPGSDRRHALPSRPCRRSRDRRGPLGAHRVPGELDYEYCRRAWTAEAAERSEQHLHEHGMPAKEAAAVRPSRSS